MRLGGAEAKTKRTGPPPLVGHFHPAVGDVLLCNTPTRVVVTVPFPVLPQMRKLYTDLASVYASLQQSHALTDHHDGDTSSAADPLGQAVLRHSRLYRATLGAHIEELQQCVRDRRDAVCQARGSLPDDAAREYESQRRRVAEYHVIWYLCEILYLCAQPEDSVTAQLLDWLHLTFYPNTTVLRLLESGETDVAAAEEAVWGLCQQLILQGCLRESALCLDLAARHYCTAADAVVLRVLGALLIELPLMGPTSAARDVLQRHGVWRTKCARMLQTARTEQCSARVLSLLALASGDEASLAACGASWVEMVVAHLLYVDPLLRRAHLRQLAQRYTSGRGVSVSALPAYQRILYGVFADEVVLALRVSEAMTQRWFPAHLVDLLHHAGVVEADTMRGARHALVMAHAESFAVAGDLHATALLYLSSLDSPEARALMAVTVSHCCPPTEAAQSRLYHLCIRYGLAEAAAGIAQAWALRQWHGGARHDALLWAQRARSHFPLLAAQMVNTLSLDQLAESPVHASSVVVVASEPSGGVAPSAFIDPAVAFVDAYRSLLRARATGDMQAAAALLMRLVGERICPRRFWLPVMELCAPLFEESERLFSVAQLRTLMGRVEALLLEDATRNASLLQLSLSRCLARSLVAP